MVTVTRLYFSRFSNLDLEDICYFCDDTVMSWIQLAGAWYRAQPN